MAYQDRERRMLKERASAVKDALFAGDASAAEEYMAIYQIEGGTRTYHDDRVVAAAVSDFEAAHPDKTGNMAIVMPCCGLGVSETTFAAALMDKGYNIRKVVLMDRCNAWVSRRPVHECIEGKLIMLDSYGELADVLPTLPTTIVIGFCAMSGDETTDPRYTSFVEVAAEHAYPVFVNYRTWTPDTYRGIMPYETEVVTTEGVVVGAKSSHEWSKLC